MKKKNSVVGLVILLLILMTACKSASSEEQKMSHEQFENLFFELSDSINVENFEVKGKSDDTNLTVIDKELSFNKRKFLTIDGTKDSPETQERIIYENTSENIVAMIDLIFLENSLNKDLVYWHFNRPHELKNKKALDIFDTAIISYNNLLVKVTVIDEERDSNKVKIIRQFLNDIVVDLKGS